MFKQTCNYITHPSGKLGVLYQAWSSEAVFQAGCWKPQILAITAKLVIGTQRRVLLASHGVLNYTWLQHCWNTSLFLFCSLQWQEVDFSVLTFEIDLSILILKFAYTPSSESNHFWVCVCICVEYLSEILSTLKHKHVCCQVVYMHSLRMLREFCST